MSSSEENVLKKYYIEKEYKIIRDQYYEPLYHVIIYTSNNDDIKFLNSQINDIGNYPFNGMLLSEFNYDVFQSKNIDAKIIKDELIPIGLVECLDLDENVNKKMFSIVIDNQRDLYKAPQILKNFEKAIEIKAQALDFVENFK